jgi:hypothetical protein
MFLDPYWFPLVVVFELVVVELFHFQIAWSLVSWRLKHVPMIEFEQNPAIARKSLTRVSHYQKRRYDLKAKKAKF